MVKLATRFAPKRKTKNLRKASKPAQNFVEAVVGKRRARVYKDAALQLYNDVSMIKNLINTEEKYKEDLDANNWRIVNSTAGSLVTPILCNGIAQGTGVTQRVGNSIKMMNLQLVGNMAYSLTKTGVQQQVRIVVVKDADPAGIAPTTAFEALFSDSSTGTWTTSLYDPEKKGTLSILSDEFYAMDIYHPTKFFNINIPLNCHALYEGSGGTISTLTKNSIHIYMIGGPDSGLVNGPLVHCAYRLLFVDN